LILEAIARIRKRFASFSRRGVEKAKSEALTPLTRREAIRAAAALGASLAWGGVFGCSRATQYRERRDLYPQGVASGDPYPDSVMLWTRRPDAQRLTCEIAGDPSFAHIISTTTATPSVDSDWTVRVLAAGLTPSTVYWYRFVDEQGFGSRIGRTITAPSPDDDQPARFVFVSCQNVTEGAQNAYRRMIFDDELRPPDEQLQFILHLGDFVYEVVNYPEDTKNGHRYDRRLREVFRYTTGEKFRNFHLPVTLEDYRILWRGYLTDPDLQDARARWPFICVWDNHEFSWLGFQSFQDFGGLRPAQTRRVAANQSWFEFQPARVLVNGKANAERFEAPAVRDTPIETFDENGIGTEPNNLAAIGSLTIYRSFRCGRNLDLIITDNHSYRAYAPADGAEGAAHAPKDVPYYLPQDIIEELDEKTRPMILGGPQKKWFFDRLRASTARWKLWGNSFGTLDWRSDFQNLPDELRTHWPSPGYAALSGGWTSYRAARAEIFDFVQRERIAGFGTVVGDRHSFVAGLLSSDLPPRKFEPVGVEFITGSISAPGLAEAAEHNIKKDHPLRALYLFDPPNGASPHCATNVSLMHGVRASLALQRTGDPAAALAARNPENAPHLTFCDVGGHGYAVVRAASDEMRVEFVCIPRPLERSEREDGGPIRYRVVHRVKPWEPGATPKLERSTIEGEPPVGM